MGPKGCIYALEGDLVAGSICAGIENLVFESYIYIASVAPVLGGCMK